MKKWLKKHWMKIAFGVLLLTVVVLLAIGIPTMTEPTLMQVCWEGNAITWIEGAPPEENRGSCEDPQGFVWPHDQLPLTVAASLPPDGQVSVGDPEGAIETAVILLNGQLGYQQLQASSTGDGEADITVVWGAAFVTGDGTTAADRAPGTCSFRRDADGRVRGTVVVRSVGTNRYAYRLLLHELGHCGLGLADDDFDDGIMATVHDDSMDERINFDRLRDDDRQAVREAYDHPDAWGCSVVQGVGL